MQQDLAPGDVFCGAYTIVRELGAGGASLVFEAVALASGKCVALKILRSSAVASADQSERFRREVLAVAGLAGPHIPVVFAIEAPPGQAPYIVLELLVGNDLSEELDLNGPLAVPTAVDYVTQAARGLGIVHAHGIVHRDVKPANVFLCAPDERGHRLVKVIDFGMSKLRDLSNIPLTRTFAVFGTPEYMSPEQVRASRDVDARSDIWSLGVVLFECLAGRAPFRGPPTRIISSIAGAPIPRLADVGVQVSSALESVLAQMLERDLARRLPSADAVIRALAPFRASEAPPPHGP